VLARFLSVSHFGVYNVITGFILVFSLVTSFGLGSSLQRFLPEYEKKEEWKRLFNTFFFSQGFRAVSGLIAIVLATISFDLFAPFFKIQQYWIPFVLFCIGSYAFFQIEFLQIAFNSIFLHFYTAIGSLFYLGLRLVLITCLLYMGYGLIGAFYADIIAYLIGCLLLWFLFFSKVYVKEKEWFEDTAAGIEWKRLLSFSLYSSATIPAGIILSQAMDVYVVAAMSTMNQVGIYALGSRASKMLLSIMPQNVLQSVIRPTFFQRYYSVKEKNVELNLMFRSLVIMNAAFLFPILALAGVQAEGILTVIFEAKFAESTTIFLIFLVFNAFTIFELPSDLVLQSIEKLHVRLYAAMFAAIYNLIAAILLMPKYGIMGVAFATGSAAMGKCVFFYVMASKYTGISFQWRGLFKIIVNTSIAATLTYLVGLLGNTNLWMFFSLIVGTCAYIGMFLMNNCLDVRDRELVNRFCKRRIFNV